MNEKERDRHCGKDAPIEFGHTLKDQIGGQHEAGSTLTGFYENYRTDEPIAKFMPS